MGSKTHVSENCNCHYKSDARRVVSSVSMLRFFFLIGVSVTSVSYLSMKNR